MLMLTVVRGTRIRLKYRLSLPGSPSSTYCRVGLKGTRRTIPHIYVFSNVGFSIPCVCLQGHSAKSRESVILVEKN